jgi:DNA-binding transcriptional ArsR family regulator
MTSTHRLRGHDVFAAVGDPTRRAMLDMLRRGELGAGELARPFRISRPAISQHLKVLKGAGLVRVRRQGREQIYALCPEPLRDVYDWVEHYRAFWSSRLEALGAFLRQKDDP